MITVHPKQSTSVTTALRAMPELRALHSVSGSYDLLHGGHGGGHVNHETHRSHTEGEKQ